MSKTITVKDKSFSVFIDNETIKTRIGDLAKEITSRHEKNDNVVFLCILNGSFRVLGELAHFIDFKAPYYFMKLASYDGLETTGNVKMELAVEEKNIAGKHVIIVEDIVDTGTTLHYLLKELQDTVKSVEVLTLLSKPAARLHHVKLDYIGFEIPNDFVVGFGLDYDQQGRELNDIYILN